MMCDNGFCGPHNLPRPYCEPLLWFTIQIENLCCILVWSGACKHWNSIIIYQIIWIYYHDTLSIVTELLWYQ